MKSKQSKACDITPAVRAKVFERDCGVCIICGKQGIPNSHYIKRSKGGLGIEENLATMCQECHNEYDNGTGEYAEAIHTAFRDYLKGCYGDEWNENDLVYDKYRWVK